MCHPLYESVSEGASSQAVGQSVYIINNLALLYVNQGRYTEAESLCRRALLIREQQLGPEHPSIATSLNNLAELYRAQEGKDAEAEPLHRRAIAIEEQLRANHPNTTTSLVNLANFYHDRRQYSEALPLHQRALAIREQVLGPDHPDVATSLYFLVLQSQL